MARKQLVPPGAKRGGRGKAPLIPPPPAAGGRKAKLAGKTGRAGAPSPLPSPPPRRRAVAGMPPPVQNRLPRPAMLEPEPMAEERMMRPPMGPAMSAGVGESPRRRAIAQALRGGRMAF